MPVVHYYAGTGIPEVGMVESDFVVVCSPSEVEARNEVWNDEAEFFVADGSVGREGAILNRVETASSHDETDKISGLHADLVDHIMGRILE